MKTPVFTIADVPGLVARGRIKQEDADRAFGKPTPAAETVRKASAQARAAENANVQREAKESLAFQLAKLGIPEPTWEYVFSSTGKRFDGAYADRKIAIEIEGGLYKKKGHHNSPLGYERDCERYNGVQLLGWRPFRFTYRMVHDGRAAETIRRAWEGA